MVSKSTPSVMVIMLRAVDFAARTPNLGTAVVGENASAADRIMGRKARLFILDVYWKNRGEGDVTVL